MCGMGRILGKNRGIENKNISTNKKSFGFGLS